MCAMWRKDFLWLVLDLIFLVPYVCYVCSLSIYPGDMGVYVVIILDRKIKNEGTKSYIVLSYQNLTEWAEYIQYLMN
jgi:hypothetical protein